MTIKLCYMTRIISVLTEQLHIPKEYNEACKRLHHFVEKHARRLLSEHYWSEEHLKNIQHHSGQGYTYIRDDNYGAFDDNEEYLYSRFRRCIFKRVTSVLEAHADEYNVFNFVIETMQQTVGEEQKIRSVDWARLRHELFDRDDYIEWSILENVVEQLNNYYDTHGQFPDRYTELVSTPRPNGTLPYAPDKGDYHIHELSIENDKVVFTMNAPDSLSPDSYNDWSEHVIEFPVNDRLARMLKQGEVGAPTLHDSEHGFTLDLPVEIDEVESELVEDRVLAIDLGVKKQATATVVEKGEEDEYEQVGQPMFFDHPCKQKLFRLKNEAENINDKLARLRREGKDHTEQFDQLLAEYRLTRRKERRLRDQIQHDLSNQLVWIALQYDCETIVFESLGQLNNPDTSGNTAWSISSWARGKLLDLTEYKSELVGLDTDTASPWGTSRHCPRCGEHGETIVAPNKREKCRHGGHFYYPSCEYECDRDVVGSLNVGRVYLANERVEAANPVTYMESGNHASLPSLVTPAVGLDVGSAVSSSARSTGVQSTTRTGFARSRQTPHVSTRSQPLHSVTCGADNAESAKSGETGLLGGLSQNYSGNTVLRETSSSVVQHVLAHATNTAVNTSVNTALHRTLPNTTEN